MQVTYALNQPIIPVGQSIELDLLVDFNATQIGEIAPRRPLDLSLAIDLVRWVARRYAMQFRRI
jgi:hypothetical protein